MLHTPSLLLQSMHFTRQAWRLRYAATLGTRVPYRCMAHWIGPNEADRGMKSTGSIERDVPRMSFIDMADRTVYGSLG